MKAVVSFSRLTDEGFRVIGSSNLPNRHMSLAGSRAHARVRCARRTTSTRLRAAGLKLEDFPDGTYAVEASLLPLVCVCVNT